MWSRRLLNLSFTFLARSFLHFGGNINRDSKHVPPLLFRITFCFAICAFYFATGIRYISATVLVFDARRRWLLAPREISLPFAPLPRNGTSLSRWSQSRVLGQKRVLVLIPGPIPSAEVVKDFPLYSFRRLALSFVRNQRATSPIRRRFLKQLSRSSSSRTST